MSRVFKTRGFCHGFTWGTGTGWEFCTRRKPVPVAQVDGFDPVSNSARKRERLPAQHEFPPTTTINQHENTSRIAKEGEWVVHPPISSKGMLSFGLYLVFVTNLKLYKIPGYSPHPTTLENECACSFLMVVGCSSAPLTNHPRKRARMLVFEGDWLSIITTIKNEHALLVFNGGWLFLITTTPPTTT